MNERPFRPYAPPALLPACLRACVQTFQKTTEDQAAAAFDACNGLNGQEEGAETKEQCKVYFLASLFASFFLNGEHFRMVSTFNPSWSDFHSNSCFCSITGKRLCRRVGVL